MSTSALYEGMVVHERAHGPRRRFSHRVTMPMLDLDDVQSLALAPLWRAEHWAPMAFRRRDYLGDPSQPLGTTVRDLVEDRLGWRPDGPIRLLAHHRTWGWCFNPIALYYCYGADGQTLTAVVADVTNTPWGESRSYVIDVREGLDRLADQPKELHVSPFLPMELSYRFRITAPSERCGFSVTVLRGEEIVFRAGLTLHRRTLSRREVARALWLRPFQTHRVSLSIYLHAVRLWLRRTPVVPHPRSGS